MVRDGKEEECRFLGTLENTDFLGLYAPLWDYKKFTVHFEKVPIFEPGNSGFKNGNFSFILGSRKELRFVLNRSFHVQLSMRSVTVVKFDILF